MSDDLIKTAVVKREDGISHTQEAVTQTASEPNVLVQTMTPLYAVFIRSLRVYAQTFMGLLSAMGLGAVDAVLQANVTPHDFLGKLQVAAWLALAPSMFTAVQNTAELIMRLDEKLPRIRG